MDPLTVGLIGAGVSAASPFISNALNKLFAGDAEQKEREAIERAKAPFRQVAEGGTTQGQAGLAYARGRALQDLQAQASRGTAQQQAGLQRAAMAQGADVQAQYASQLAELRSWEQERARQKLASIEGMEAQRAAAEAQRQRQMISGAIGGAATSLIGGLLTPAASTAAGLTKGEIDAYNAEQASARPRPLKYGLDNPDNPFAAKGQAMTAGPAAPAASPAAASAPVATAGQTLADVAVPATATAAAPTLARPTSAELASIGLFERGKYPGSTPTYQQRTKRPGVTAREAALPMASAHMRKLGEIPSLFWDNPRGSF